MMGRRTLQEKWERKQQRAVGELGRRAALDERHEAARRWSETHPPITANEALRRIAAYAAVFTRWVR